MITLQEILIDCNDNHSEAGFFSIEKFPLNHEPLVILMTDGRNTYECSIHENQVKFPMYNDDTFPVDVDNQMRWLIEGICNHTNHVSLHFMKRLKPTDEHEFSAEIKHSSVVVRVIWKGLFQLIKNDNVHFLKHIVQTVSETKYQLAGLWDTNDRLVKDVSIWKETAERLQEKHWEKERDEMMNNFLVLINEVKKQLRNVKSELDQQKLVNDQLQDRLKRISTTREQVIDHIDQHDMEIFDTEEVELLAAGKRVQSRERTAPEYPVLVDNEDQTGGINMHVRRNPISGALEYFDVQKIEVASDTCKIPKPSL